MGTPIFDELEENGYVVLEDFLTPDEVNELRAAGDNLCNEAPEESRVVFSTLPNCEAHQREKYFLDSGDKVRHFFESGAIDEKGQLVVEPLKALNKVGHALHTEHPIFEKITFSNQVKEACWQLGFNKPAVLQSMYIFKNPGVGGEVVPHQDSWYLYTEPPSAIGFWIALDDATIQNGCLQFIKGSHKSGVHRRYIRNPDKDAKDLVVYDRPAPIYPQSNFTPVPVSRGTCILIDGQVVHKSDHNKSDKSRHVYTFHVIETEDTKYSEDNWLQAPEDKPFPILYEKKKE